MKATTALLASLSLLMTQAAVADPLDRASSDIFNFHVEEEGVVFRGGSPTEQGISDLTSLGVRTIVDLQGGDLHGQNPLFDLYDYLFEPGERPENIERERDWARAQGIEFVNTPLNGTDPVSDEEAQTIQEIVDLLHDKSKQPVYVHCQHGKDRTGLVMALYAVKYLKRTPQEAHDEMVQDGHSGVIDQFITGELDKFFWKVVGDYVTVN